MSRLAHRWTGRGSRRRGLSLMEVILAMSILGLTIAIIGELLRIGARSAATARDLTIAQMLCESKMAEISAGVLAPDAVPPTPFEVETEWLYQIEVEPTDQEGLLAVHVTVTMELDQGSNPTSFSIRRWMADPDYLETLQAAEEELLAAEADAG